jgi:hypothetical protein
MNKKIIAIALGIAMLSVGMIAGMPGAKASFDNNEAATVSAQCAGGCGLGLHQPFYGGGFYNRSIYRGYNNFFPSYGYGFNRGCGCGNYGGFNNGLYNGLYNGIGF